MLYHIQTGIITFEIVLLFNLVSNLWVLRRMGSYSLPADWPRVSILVPARNEEGNIERCVRSLLAQQYPNFQILVLDDQSTDRTGQILDKLAAEDSRLQVLKGKALPPDWIGKHWACHQLAQQADGELLLFTDADTRHHPLTLRDSVAALVSEQADLLTAMPHEEAVSWGERLVIPLIPWSIFCFVPLALAYRLPYAALSATIGQFMLFRRSAYNKIGGYESVRDHVVDDIALGRRIKAHGLCWRLVDGSRHVRCRMYHNFQQVYQGLSKNLFATFEYKIPHYLFVWGWLGLVFLSPPLIVMMGLVGFQLPAYAFILAIIAIAVALLLWGLTHWRFGFPRYLMFFYPITVLLSMIIATNSLILTLTHRATWKDRTLPGHIFVGQKTD